MMASVSPFWLLCCYLCYGLTFAAFTDKSRVDFEVRGLEEIEPAFESFDGQMYAGLLPIAHPSHIKNKGKRGNTCSGCLRPLLQRSTIP